MQMLAIRLIRSWSYCETVRGPSAALLSLGLIVKVTPKYDESFHARPVFGLKRCNVKNVDALVLVEMHFAIKLVHRHSTFNKKLFKLKEARNVFPQLTYMSGQ